jgi:hypothetical protein
MTKNEEISFKNSAIKTIRDLQNENARLKDAYGKRKKNRSLSETKIQGLQGVQVLQDLQKIKNTLGVKNINS